MGATNMNEHAARRIVSRLRMESESTYLLFTGFPVLLARSLTTLFVSYFYFKEFLYSETN